MKDITITIRTSAQIRDKAKENAAKERRSLSSYLECLIERDSNPPKEKPPPVAGE